MELVKGWKTWWKQWSTWLVSVGASVAAFAPELLYMWNDLPIDIKAAFPVEYVRFFGYILIIASIPARQIRQKKLYTAVQEEE